MSSHDTDAPRDYGGWRRRRGIGMFGFGAAGTAAVLGALLALIITATADAAALLYLTPPVLLAGGLGLARIGGEPLAVAALRRIRWQYGSARNWTRYRAAVVAGHSPGFQMPGVLAPLTLLDCEDGYGGRYGIVLDRRTGLMTPTLRVIPASTWLANRADADTWVANWGGWLASLGYLPMVRHVTVTIDTAPEPGTSLADSVAAALDPASPLAARQIMGQLAASAPAAAADVDTRVSISFDPRLSPAAPDGLTAAAAEVGRIMHGLESALGTCGVTVLGRASAAELAGIVRTAFDPAARGEVNRILAPPQPAPPAQELSWADAGPVGAEEEAGCYRHDSGISVTWAWSEAPRQTVTADVLARLVAPGRHPKRVSLQYRPFPAAEATRVLESEVNAAQFRAVYKRRTGRDETARDSHDQARARQAAAEEAAGAGVCLVSLYVTVTVTSDAELPRAAAETEAAAESSKIRMRRMTYSQAAGWAATLPVRDLPGRAGPADAPLAPGAVMTSLHPARYPRPARPGQPRLAAGPRAGHPDARHRSRQRGDGRSPAPAAPRTSPRHRSTRPPPPRSAGCSRSPPAPAPRPSAPRSDGTSCSARWYAWTRWPGCAPG